jgi:hypothetical protein
MLKKVGKIVGLVLRGCRDGMKQAAEERRSRLDSVAQGCFIFGCDKEMKCV